MKVRKLILLAVAIGCLSSAAFADAAFTNGGGNLFLKSQSGMYFITTGNAGSSLTSVAGAGGLNCGGQLPACVGTVNYTTPFMTLNQINNITGGATMLGNGSMSIGGAFKIVENGATVFSGTFTSLIWTYIGSCTSTVSCKTVGLNYQWTLQGTVTGTYMGQQVNGATIQLTTSKMVATKGHPVNDPFGSKGNGIIGLATGGSTFSVVPESSTLILFGTGLVAIALFARRRQSSGLQA